MAKKHDAVHTLVAKGDYPAGMRGVAVSLYATSHACEVEPRDEGAYSVDAVAYLFEEMKSIEE